VDDAVFHAGRQLLDDPRACHRQPRGGDALGVYELINNANPVWGRRDQMVHVQLVDPADQPRFGQLGVVPDMQLQRAELGTYTVDALQPYVSPEVWNTMYPARSLARSVPS
jgi:predicted amidohydrolase YtcJ